MPAHLLAQAFLATLAAPRADELTRQAGDETRLDERLAAIVARARQAWPDLAVAPEHYVAYLAARVGDGGLDALHTDDLYLACACAEGTAAALAAFERACIALLPGALAGAGASATLIDDIQQMLRARFLVAVDGKRGIEQYSGRGELRGWVNVAALREVVRARGKTRHETQIEDDTILDCLVARDDPELARLRAQCATELRLVFRGALLHLTPRERNLLRLHFIDGLSIDEIGELHEVHRSTAARWLAKAERRLQKQVRRDLKELMSVNTTELAELWQAVESQLEVNIDILLRSSTSISTSSDGLGSEPPGNSGNPLGAPGRRKSTRAADPCIFSAT